MSRNKNYKKVRIFVASPQDVKPERAKVEKVAGSLSRTGNLADELGISLEVLDWHHAVAEMGRPEDVLLERLPVNTWDVFIGILWLTFGTPPGASDPETGKAYHSGTEEEFRLAYRAWRKTGRPHIAFFRCLRGPEDMAAFPAEQYARVQRFFDGLQAGGRNPGIYTGYHTLPEFVVRLRETLESLLLSGSRLPGKKGRLVTLPAGPQTDESAIQQGYLDFVYQEHGKIKLFGFISEANIAVKTMEVFVSLQFNAVARELHLKGAPSAGRAEHRLRPGRVLRRALSEGKALLILGGPGYGKTTMLKYFAVCNLSPEGREKLGLDRSLLPLLVPLRQIDPAKTFTSAISRWAKERKQPVSAGLWKRWLAEPGCLVMLDGLDEVSDPESRKQVCRWIDKAVRQFPQSTFLVTCRFTGYHELGEGGLQSGHLRYDVLPLNNAQKETFFRQWFEAASRASLDSDELEDASRLKAVRELAEEDTAKIMVTLRNEENRSLSELATVPVLLQILAIIWREQGEESLSGERVDLYDRSIDFLLEHREKFKSIPRLLNARKARMVLRPLALWMQQETRNDEAAFSEIVDKIRSRLQAVEPGLAPEDFLENIRDRAGVLVGSGAETYQFQHKSFREFLAAIELANRRQPELLVEHFEDAWWRETILFCAGIASPEIFPDFLELFLPHKLNSSATPPLLLQLMDEAASKPVEPFSKILTGDSKAGNKYNALMCLRKMRSPEAEEVVKGSMADATPMVSELARQISAEWGNVGATRGPRSGTRLTRTVTGEPRRAAGADAVFQNPVENNSDYIRIEGGRYRYSVDKSETDIATFFLARYPVTNKLYRRFLRHVSGKTVNGVVRFDARDFEKSWRAGASDMPEFVKHAESGPWAELFQADYDDDKRFNGDEQPVVGVPWFAAASYCQWLNWCHSRSAGSGKNDVVFRLPGEEEWEWAASGGKRRYPWGDAEPDKERANYDEHIGETTPVGSYPKGATPEGLMDMAGNVWEWQGNWSDADRDARALRGGAWNYDTGNLRCAARGMLDPDDGDYDVGFRVLCAQSPK